MGTTHIPTTINITVEDTGAQFSATSFQLLQWKAALKLEAKGLTMSRGRKVSTHLRKLTGLGRKATIDQLYNLVFDMITGYNQQLEEGSAGHE